MSSVSFNVGKLVDFFFLINSVHSRIEYIYFVTFIFDI